MLSAQDWHWTSWCVRLMLMLDRKLTAKATEVVTTRREQ